MRLQIASLVVRLNHTEHPTQTLPQLARVNYPPPHSTSACARTQFLTYCRPAKVKSSYPESVRAHKQHSKHTLREFPFLRARASDCDRTHMRAHPAPQSGVFHSWRTDKCEFESTQTGVGCTETGAKAPLMFSHARNASARTHGSNLSHFIAF